MHFSLLWFWTKSHSHWVDWSFFFCVIILCSTFFTNRLRLIVLIVFTKKHKNHYKNNFFNVIVSIVRSFSINTVLFLQILKISHHFLNIFLKHVHNCVSITHTHLYIVNGIRMRRRSPVRSLSGIGPRCSRKVQWRFKRDAWPL